MPLKQAMSAEIAEALVERFINLYTAPKAWITEKGPNFVSKVIRHKYEAHRYLQNSVYRLESNASIERPHYVTEYLKQ